MYQRVLLKLSGEALSGSSGILSDEKLTEVASAIAAASAKGTQFAVVIGAGNIWRGARQGGLSIDRVRGDHMGMLATVINSLALQDYLLKAGQEAVVMSAVPMEEFCEHYNQYRADAALAAGKTVIVSCGVGYPFFSTDTGMMLRAAELKAEVVLAAKNIDGVYDKDPAKYSDAKKYPILTYDEMMEKNLKAIDQTAAAFGRENGIRALVFALSGENIVKAAAGEIIGTIIE